MTTCSVDKCERPVRAVGMCNRHYENVRLRGNPVPVRDLPLYEQVSLHGWDVMPGGCWEYRGSRNELGYGKYGGVRVHRIVFEHHNEPLAPGLVVRHTCDNPPCCNPAHLLSGTQAENCRDMAERGRRKRSVCPHGHDRTVPGATRTTKGGVVLCVICDRNRKRRWEERKRTAA